MNKDTLECITRLTKAGITLVDAIAFRRISITLHRWHELECGDTNGKTLERDEKTNKPYITYERIGGQRGRYSIPDREAGARKRLAKILKHYPAFKAYVQGDPRGAALYILRPGDVPEGQEIDACYSNGIAIYK